MKNNRLTDRSELSEGASLPPDVLGDKKNERKQMEYYNGHSKLCQPTSKDLKMEEEVIEEGQNITTSSTITLGEK